MSVKIAVLVSGGGTNLQAMIDAWKAGNLQCGEIALVVSSSETAYALKRAEQNGIESVALTRSAYKTPEDYDKALLNVLLERGIELVVLAGYLRIIGAEVLEAYRGRIINIHPSLIPSFCGDGYYGLKVHEAALKYGVKVTGATVHYVSEVVDGGEILLQKAVPVEDGDTPETLQKRVMEQAEWLILPEATSILCGKIAREREMRV